MVQEASGLDREIVNAEIRRWVEDTIAGLGKEVPVKARLWQAALALGLPFWRVSEFHYGRVRRIEAHEAFQIIKNARVERARQEREQFEKARREYEAYRLETANAVPSALERLLPPSVEALPDFGEGTEE